MSVLTPAAFFFLPVARGSLPTLSLSLILTKRKPLGLLSLLCGYHYEGRRQRAGLEHQELWWATAVRGEIVFGDKTAVKGAGLLMPGMLMPD